MARADITMARNEHVCIKTLGTVTADIQFGEWNSHNCSIEIVPDNRQTILGRGQLRELGLRMEQMVLPDKFVSTQVIV